MDVDSRRPLMSHLRDLLEEISRMASGMVCYNYNRSKGRSTLPGGGAASHFDA